MTSRTFIGICTLLDHETTLYSYSGIYVVQYKKVSFWAHGVFTQNIYGGTGNLESGGHRNAIYQDTRTEQD